MKTKSQQKPQFSSFPPGLCSYKPITALSQCWSRNQRALLAQVGHFPAHSDFQDYNTKKYRTFQNRIILGQIFQTVLNNKSKENETVVDSHKQKDRILRTRQIKIISPVLPTQKRLLPLPQPILSPKKLWNLTKFILGSKGKECIGQECWWYPNRNANPTRANC